MLFNFLILFLLLFFQNFIIFLHTYNEVEHTVKTFLFDSIEAHENLLPLSFTRPVADFRCGIITIREKWEHFLLRDCHFLPVEYLKYKFGSPVREEKDAIFIAGNLLPRPGIVKQVLNLEKGQCIIHHEKPIAFRGSFEEWESKNWRPLEAETDIELIEYVFDLFLKNGEEIKRDFELLTSGRKSAPLPECVHLISSPGNNIFIEEGAIVECGSLNTKEGPIYIGKDTILMEGSCIRGPFALCEGAEVRMGTKIYEETTIGPHCKVGGEISNTVFFGYSNKAHDGYVGNAVIGEWCNIGAGTNASNLKNDYSLIRVWNYRSHSFMRTNLQFCGLIMGDHSKIGVNCMINTATVIGVGVNLHGAGFPRTFVPNFSEGSPTQGFSTVPLKKFVDTATRVMSRRDKRLSEEDLDVIKEIYER